jgi:hypothetical protein
MCIFDKAAVQVCNILRVQLHVSDGDMSFLSFCKLVLC